MRTAAIAALFVLLCGAASGIARAAGSEEVPSIQAIEIAGNDHIGAGAIRGVMRLRQPVWWNPFRSTPYLGPDYLSIDLYRVLQLYRDRGYALAYIRKAQVRYNEAGDRVRIRIEVEEGPLYRIRDISLTGVDARHRPQVEDRIGVSVGDALARSRLDAGRDAIAAFYGDDGYVAARVHDDATLRNDSAGVTVRVLEGPRYRMRRVEIDTTASILGNTKKSVILREVALKPGGVFRTSLVLKTQEQILRTGVFRTVRVVSVPDSTGLPFADLRIIAHARNSGWYGFGAGFSSNSQINFSGEWGNRNISGFARSLTVNSEIAFSLAPEFKGPGLPLKSMQGAIGYVEPFVFGTRTASLTNLSHKYERQPGLKFDQDITDLSETLKRSLGRYSIGYLTLHNEWIRSSDPSVLLTHYVTRKLSSTLEEDHRDNLLNPMKGSYRQLFAEYAGGPLGGQYQFSGWTLTGSWYVPVRDGLVVAMRTRGGWIVPIGGSSSPDSLPAQRLPYEERFLLGGGTTVRGYSENSLGLMTNGEAIGGIAMFLGNLELRFPLLWLLSGAVFLDSGNVWGDRHQVSIRGFQDGLRSGTYNPLNVAYGAGGGLRFMTPVGPFRVDYGLKLGSGRAPGQKQGGLHLSLGQAF